MSLTDIMSAAGLDGYAEVGLVLFLIAFLVIVVRVFQPSRKRSWERAARLPFDDDHPQQPRDRAGST
jgi:cbb3-type cytochrome oxidase subunit 3